MPKRGKQSGNKSQGGAPEWMVTFSDCMTLLLTFFVLLLTFSSFDERVFLRFRNNFINQLRYLNVTARKQEDSFLHVEQVHLHKEPDEGSEKRTTEDEWEGRLSRNVLSKLSKRRVFLVPSSEIYWGDGSVISAEGKETLRLMGALLQRLRSRVVISENSKVAGNSDIDFGLGRAWAVVDFLTSQCGVDRGRFSITALSTVAADIPETNELSGGEVPGGRKLEIVLLERRIYP